MLYTLLKWVAYAICFIPFIAVILSAPSIGFQIIAGIMLTCFLGRTLFYPFTSRIVFCLKLRWICRRSKLTCKFRHFWLRSFFLKSDGYDVEISDRKTDMYSIKFFCGNMNGKGIHLRNDSCAEVIRYLVVPRLGGRHAMGRTMGRTERVEASRTLVDYEMPIAAYGKSILLISPSPNSVTVLEQNKSRVVGSGENYLGFSIYTTRGFLAYLKRQTP